MSVVFGLVALVARAANLIPIPGYTQPILSLSLFFGALNLFGLGIVGSYSWRAYEGTKRRPPYIVKFSNELFDGGAGGQKERQ